MNLGKLQGQWRYLSSQPGFRDFPVRVLFRLMIWRFLCWLGKPVNLCLTGHQLTLFLPPEWHGSSKLLYVFRDAYEPDLGVLKKFLGPHKVMIDVGANYGVFSLNASRLVGPAGQVVSFEPAQATFSVLRKNLELNRSENVRPLRLALAEKPGRLRLYHDPDPTRNSLAAAGPAQDYEEVEVRTLDDVLAELGIRRVDFIKIDVEGADELVCRGAMQTLRANFPPVFFESNREAAVRMGLKENGTSTALAELGYRFYSFEAGELTDPPQMAIPEGNLLALHPNSVSQTEISALQENRPISGS